MHNLMPCSQPIIAMVAGKSETADVIHRAQCGIVARPGDTGSVQSAVSSPARRWETTTEVPWRLS